VYKLQQVPTAMPDVACAALPLLQQLQRCGPLLPFSAAAAATGSGSSAASAGSVFTTAVSLAYYSAQMRGLQLVNVVSRVAEQLGSAGHLHAWQLISDPAVKELVLQELMICTSLNHTAHTEEQQQQKAEGNQPSSGSKDSGSRPSTEGSNTCDARRQQQQPHKPSADLLAIPALHQDLVQLLPGGQAYVNGVAAAAAAESDRDHRKQLSQHWVGASTAVLLLNEVLAGEALNRPGSKTPDSSSPLLSGAALKLVLEVQLLAAAELQRQRKQRSSSSVEGLTERLTVTLLNCNVLLQRLLGNMAEASGSGLPPELLQQAGLQLLQALAAPLQQVQLCKAGATLLTRAKEGVGALQYQMFDLQVAAAGLFVHQPGGTWGGALSALQVGSHHRTNKT
jgi:hypothetical protein